LKRRIIVLNLLISIFLEKIYIKMGDWTVILGIFLKKYINFCKNMWFCGIFFAIYAYICPIFNIEAYGKYP